jgi:methionine-rich copper-binding protein CopC
MKMSKKFVFLSVCAMLLVTAACSPAATPAQPTADAAMMAKETDTAMMAKETDSAMMAKETESAAMAKPTDAAMSGNDAMMKIPAQQFAAHFVDSMPMHEATLDKTPTEIQLNFNFTLSEASTITIEKDGKELKSAPGKLGDKRLSMTTEIPADAGAGLYLVKYKACWPDNSCHNGQFAFVVK